MFPAVYLNSASNSFYISHFSIFFSPPHTPLRYFSLPARPCIHYFLRISIFSSFCIPLYSLFIIYAACQPSLTGIWHTPHSIFISLSFLASAFNSTLSSSMIPLFCLLSPRYNSIFYLIPLINYPLSCMFLYFLPFLLSHLISVFYISLFIRLRPLPSSQCKPSPPTFISTFHFPFSLILRSSHLSSHPFMLTYFEFSFS